MGALESCGASSPQRDRPEICQRVTTPATVRIEVAPVNDPPVCTAVMTSPDSLWPPDNNFISVSLINLTDPDGDPVSVELVD